MTKIGLLSMLMLVCIIACKKEPAKILDNSARKAVSQLLQDTLTGTDWSGTVHIIIVTQEQYGEINNVDIAVPDDYVLVGGGAEVIPTDSLPGALLTASYPDVDFTTWHAASKDHLVPFEHTLVGYAIGLKLDGFKKDDLITYMNISSYTSAYAQHPSAIVSIPDGYTLLGGGAYVDWSGAGNLLVESFPTGSTWNVASKDHDEVSLASITAYAISINSQLLLKGPWEVTQSVDSLYVSSGFETLELDLDKSWVLSCPGGAASYNSWGRMLNGIVPGIRDVTVGSQDHTVPDGGITYAYGIAIRKQF